MTFFLHVSDFQNFLHLHPFSNMFHDDYPNDICRFPWKYEFVIDIQVQLFFVTCTLSILIYWCTSILMRTLATFSTAAPTLQNVNSA
jgi:hypothetical protein